MVSLVAVPAHISYYVTVGLMIYVDGVDTLVMCCISVVGRCVSQKQSGCYMFDAVQYIKVDFRHSVASLHTSSLASKPCF